MWQVLVYNEATACVAGGPACLILPVAYTHFLILVMFFKTVFGNSPLRRIQRPLVGLLAAVVVLGPAASLALACPFCSAVSQTIRQEMEVMDAVVIAESTPTSLRNEETGEVLLKVVKVLKGDEHVKPDSALSVVYYGKVEPGRRFMLSGVDPPNLQWSVVPLNAESEAYVLAVTKLPDDALERLKFFQNYLQHEDPMLTRDSYDEFAITPYPVVQSLKPFMNHDQLVQWIQDPEMPADRKRLYLTMLGVCGTAADVPMLEKMINSTQPSARSGLDALLACYLLLAGEDGLQLVDKLFLANHQAPYADTYAAIMAIRFHGTETDKIPRSRLVQSLHHVLDRKDLADLVIPDLARWGDWSQIDRLVKLFIEADEDNNWIRVPVVNYLRACPQPEAEAALEKLKEIDPESVRRASSFFSVPIPQAPAQPATSFRSGKAAGGFASAQTAAQAAQQLSGQPLAWNVDHPPLTALASAASNESRAAGPLATVAMNPAKLFGVMLLTVTTLVIALYLVLTGGGASSLSATGSARV